MEEKKDENSQQINIKVKDQDNGEVHFKVKTTTKFEKIFQAYCQKKALDIETVKFLYDGNRVRKDQTPAELEMEDEDSIDAMLMQTGGAF